MSHSIAPDGRRLVIDGQQTFLLADTVWSAFSHATEHEWESYLDVRASQGFNAVLISVLPILDDTPDSRRTPVLGSGDDRFADALSDRYLTHAKDLVARAKRKGITALLVLLWCNYVPGSGSEQDPEGRCITDAEVDDYVSRVVHTFTDSDPIYLVSGDADFRHADATAIYLEAARALRRHAPEALMGTHPSADRPLVPADLSDQLDFVLYQSGHDPNAPQLAHEHATTLIADDRNHGRSQRPLLNGEPCYEGIGFAFRYGRFGGADVRRAMWSSVLAGAGAGVAYGAHGVWQWYRSGETYRGAHFASWPFDFRDALHFPGARDAGLVRALAEQHALADLIERQDLLGLTPHPNPDPRQVPPPLDHTVRIGASADMGTVAVFLPSAAEVELTGVDLTAHTVASYDLTTGRREDVALDSNPSRTRFGMPRSLGDWLHIVTN